MRCRSDEITYLCPDCRIWLPFWRFEGAGVGDTLRTDDGIDITLIGVQGPVETPNGWIIDDPKGELIAVEMESFAGLQGLVLPELTI